MTQNTFVRVKRSCLHNVRITKSDPNSAAELNEGLVLPREMMRLCDIAPFEQINLTKIGGNNWINRMYTFVIPGDTDEVEARGSIAYLLGQGELCCAITTTMLDPKQHASHVAGSYSIPIVDVRLYPEESATNDLRGAKLVLERNGRFDRADDMTPAIVDSRAELPRTYLSNLLSNLTIETVEKRGCIEMSAELPIEYMTKAGFCSAQSIMVYNQSRGGYSAESYVVPSLTKKTVGISGALTAVADMGDRISEAAYVTSTDAVTPIIYDARKTQVPA